MTNVLMWVKTRLLGADEVGKPYECVMCNTRMARQPFNCPDCGCYQVNWIGWRADRELVE